MNLLNMQNELFEFESQKDLNFIHNFFCEYLLKLDGCGPSFSNANLC